MTRNAALESPCIYPGRGAMNGEGMPEEERDTIAEHPLHKKLGMRPGTTGFIIAPPDEDSDPLLPLPDGYTVLADADGLATLEQPADHIHYFARNRADLARVFAQLRDGLSPTGTLWISWIKQSSGRRGGGLPGDLNENTIRRIALTSGMVDIKVASLDHDWAALKLVRRKH